MEAMAESNMKVVYTVVDKNHPGDNHPVYGNELYETVLKEVISDAMSVLPCRDVNVFLDSNGFIYGGDCACKRRIQIYSKRA